MAAAAEPIRGLVFVLLLLVYALYERCGAAELLAAMELAQAQGAGSHPRIARRGIESSELDAATVGSAPLDRGTHQRLLAYRRLTIRFDRRPASVLAVLHLACALICVRFLSHAEQD